MKLAKETRREVIKALKLCRLYEQMGYHPGYEPRTTAAYSLAPSGKTNAVHSTTEETAQRNVDTERERREHVERVRRALQVLTPMERDIIERRYFQDMSYIRIAMELYIGKSAYYHHEEKALTKLAMVLGLLLPEEERQAAGML